MSDLARRIASLSPEQRERLLSRLAEQAGETAPLPGMRRREDPSAPAPLSWFQESLWLLDQMNPGTALYNVPANLRLEGDLDAGVLERSLNEIVRRHEALRTTLVATGGRPRQNALAALTLPLPLEDLAGAPEPERETRARRLAEEEVRAPFDLARGPLIRARLLRLAGDRHLLLITLHHIISDGRSVGLLWRELEALYAAFAAGRPSPLPEQALQYADFAAWQRATLEDDALESQRGWWMERLAPPLPRLELPADHARPRLRSFRGGIHRFEWTAGTSRALRELGRREGATLFMTLLAAFQAFLLRYTGQTDLLVGSPMADRSRSETEGLFGCFVNTLVFRTDASGDPEFTTLLARVKETALGVFAHREMPFEKLVEAIAPERDSSHAPLFQTVFVLQSEGTEALELPGLRALPYEIHTGTSKFDLTLSIIDGAETLRGSLEYDGELFDADTIERMAAHFLILLDGIAADPRTPLSKLPLIGDAERERLLVEWNPGSPVPPRRETLVGVFEAQVERTPDAEALSFETTRLTYRELNRRANRLAHVLAARGVGAEVLVGLCLERSIELVVALLAILKAGGAYVPLDPTYPRERLAFMLEDTAAPVVVTDSAIAPRLGGGAATRVCLDLDAAEIAAADDGNPPPRSQADHLAYVIYTSGSTGRPKGVTIAHAHVVRLFDATRPWFSFGERDVWTLFHSCAFDFSVWEIWGALLHGGRLVVVPWWVTRSPQDFHALLSAEGVTVLNQTPSAFRQLIQSDAAGPRDGSPLRLVIFGGEALEPRTLKPWLDRHGENRPQLVNMYGITETTVHVTYRRITRADVERGGASPIGRPIPDLAVYVLDRWGNPAPIGVPGEIHVGGAGVTRGYLKRPELDASRLIPDPFSGTPGNRLYRSGDLARFRADGGLEFLGRVDDQVKIRGFRIELGEIEAALLAHPAVREAVVLALGAGGDLHLAAYLTLDRGRTASVEDLRATLETRLPEYMVPSSLVILAAMPLTANGKVDRRALPAPGPDRPELSEAYVAPRTPAEELLARIWCDVLGLQTIGVHDGFFALGGDSIRGVRVVAQARARGLDLSLQRLFQEPTIAELARGLESRAGGSDAAAGTVAATDSALPFEQIAAEDRAKLPSEIEDAYPLTLLQGGMIFHMELTPEAPVYHNVDSLHLKGRFDEALFREAIQAAVARHPVLRTSFDLTGFSQPLQLVHPRAFPVLQVEDLRHLSFDEQERRLADFVEAQKRERFEWSKPGLLRFFVHRRGDDSFQFTITEFHPIIDGWSINSTLVEIFSHHYARLSGQPAPAEPPLARTFADYVRIERRTLEAPEHRRYWAETLADAVVMKLPRWPEAYRRHDAQRVRTRYVRLTVEESDRLRVLARALRVPLKSLLLAAHVKVMSLLAGHCDVMTGMVFNGRAEEVDGDRVRGLFLNVVPFRQRLAAGSWEELIRDTFRIERELLPHRRFPLAAIQREWGRGEPLFETLFNYVDFHVLETLLKSGQVEVLNLTQRSEETNFALQTAFSGVNLVATELGPVLDYDSRELSLEQVQNLGESYARVLRAIAADPAARHDRGHWLGDTEAVTLLRTWNDTQATFPEDALLHELFEEQVSRTPDRVAVSFEAEALTFGELNRCADRLAAALRAAGVGPESVVGIAAERSIELVVGLLAILKAGGAYLPLDPDYPAERLAFMLEDAGVEVLVGQARISSLLPAGSWRKIALDGAASAIPPPDPAAGTGRSGALADNPAYVIYTSGSTGRPKGVVVPHRGIVNRLVWMQNAYRLTVDDRVLQKTPFSFDVSVWEFFWPLLAGSTLVMARPRGHQDSAYLRDLIVSEGITVTHFVPSMLQAFLAEPAVESCASLRLVICSGESLSLELQERFFERLPARLENLYGPTEASVDVTYEACERGGTARSVPIGRPIANTRIYLLNAALEPVPIGAQGELYIGGVGLARGYLKRAALTAERFLPSPFAEEPGQRLYRTGDLARFLPDGRIEFLGRADGQIKIRGFRVELQEIETVLQGHEDVRDCVVVADHDSGSARLVAYVVGSEGAAAWPLRRFLQAKLPPYMVPAQFVRLESLPLSPSGKVDRRALPAPDGARPELERAYVEPGTPLEIALAEVWREVLGLDRVGIHDTFFDLGGHSLQSLVVVSKLEQRLNVRIPLQGLFLQTLGQLAAGTEALIAAAPPAARG